MSWYNAALLGALFTAGQTPGQTGQPAPAGPVTAAAPIVTPAASTPVEAAPLSFAEAERPGGFLVGDTAFPRFISPVSNPVFSKDPRAQTYIRGLFINDVIPGDHPLGGGSFQAMAAQVNVALSERLTFIADKDGYAWINPQRAASSSGFLNLGAGLKYSLIRDVENQFILSTGFMYELPTGERSAFSGQGDGTMTFFGTFGKEWRENWHALGTFGYQLPLDSNSNSSYFYTSLHFDYRATCWFYPIAELNWFHYTAGAIEAYRPPSAKAMGSSISARRAWRATILSPRRSAAGSSWAITFRPAWFGSSRCRTGKISSAIA